VESVAFIVLDALGLTSLDYSFPYIARWSNGDAAVVRDAAARVTACSTSILRGLEQPTLETFQPMRVQPRTAASAQRRSSAASHLPPSKGPRSDRHAFSGCTSSFARPTRPWGMGSGCRFCPTASQLELKRGDRPASNQTDRPASNQTDRPASNQTDRPASNQTDRPASNQTDRPASNQTDRPASDEPTDRIGAPVFCCPFARYGVVFVEIIRIPAPNPVLRRRLIWYR